MPQRTWSCASRWRISPYGWVVKPQLATVEGVTEVNHTDTNGRHTYTIQAQSGRDLRDDISQEVISNGWSLRGLQMVSMSLEEIFLRLTTHEEL